MADAAKREGASADALSTGRLESSWNRSLSPALWLGGMATIAVWIVVRLIALGPNNRDRDQQYYAVKRLAAGHLHAVLSGGPAQTAAPGYPLFALPFDLLFRWGPFRSWPADTGYLIAGWVTLMVLAATTLVLLRAVGIPRRSPTELITLAAVAGGSATTAAYTEAYHPGDLMALACILLAITGAVRQRWAWVGVALGAGFVCKGWALFALFVMVALFPERGARARIVAGFAAVATVVILPFFIADPHGTRVAMSDLRIGPTRRTIWPFIYQPRTWSPLDIQARYLPLLALCVFCIWLARRRPQVTPELLITILAVVFLVRPVVDPAGYVYYMAPGCALLALCSRRWTWPVLSLAIALAIDGLDKPTLETIWSASAGMAVMLIALGFAVVRLHRLIVAAPRAERPPDQPSRKVSIWAPSALSRSAKPS